MIKKTYFIAHSAIIAALYVVLTHFQNLLFPNSASMAIQFRISEALCVLSFFTPTAIPGLTIGCFLFNITSSAALPLDFLLGSLATFLATGAMWKLRRFPLLGLLMPALFNSLLVGWELTHYIGEAFAFNAACVAIGEIAVLFSLGMVLYHAIKKRNLHLKLFRS